MGFLSFSLSSIYQSRKAVKQQKRANELQNKLADVRAARDRRQQAREAAIARGSLQNQAAQTGVVGSSGFMMGMQNISTQEKANIGYIATDRAFGSAISGLNQSAADYQSRAATYGAIANIFAQFTPKPGG